MQVLSIGRDARNQVILNDNSVSRRHAELTISDTGQVTIKDLGSSNGTLVNGNTISECVIKSGDIVKCGSVFLNWQQYVHTGNSKTDKSLISFSPVVETFSSPIPSVEKHFNPPPVPPAPTAAAVPSPIAQNWQANSPQPIHQNVIIMGKAKSVGVAFLLAFFFGPLGLLYASVAGGIIMFILAIPIIFLTAGIGLFFIMPVCAIWAVVAANQANSALQNRMANNYYQNK